MHHYNNSTVVTSKLHPESLVLEVDDVTETKLDMGNFKNCGSTIVLVAIIFIHLELPSFRPF